MTAENILRILNTVANYGTLFALCALGWRDRARTRSTNRILSRISENEQDPRS